MASDRRQRQPESGNVTISRIDPVGNYAIRLAFSDGHDTGLFSWDILRTSASAMRA